MGETVLTAVTPSGTCPLCSETRPKPLFAKGGKSFASCSRCGLIFQDPPPSALSHQEFFKETYYDSLGDRVPDILQARRRLYEDILLECYSFKQSGRLLDIGSGHGDFMKIAHEHGWEAWGIEPSDEASREAARTFGERAISGTVESVDFPEGHFDVVTFWNVLDHLIDPVTVLRKIRKWLSPEGVLIVRTPNSLFHFWLYRFYKVFCPVLNLLGWTKDPSIFLRANFDSKTLQRILQDTGFLNVLIRNGKQTPGDPYRVFSFFVLMGFGKMLLNAVAGFIAFFTSNRFLVGSNLIAMASPRGVLKVAPAGGVKLRHYLKMTVVHSLAFLGYILGFPFWKRMTGKDKYLKVLLYHSVERCPREDIAVSIRNFSAQLDLLKKKYEVISLDKVYDYLRQGKIPDRPSVAIAFDDGYADNYQIVHPILKKKGIRAFFFLITSDENSPERSTAHLAQKRAEKSKLLSWEDVRTMAREGHGFGSHSVSHLRLHTLTLQDQARELELSKKIIENELGEKVRFFSYPYGTCLDFDSRTEVLASRAGYEAAFSKIFGTNSCQSNLFAIKRIGIEAGDTLFSFAAKLNGALDILSFFDLPLVRKTVRWINYLFVKRKPLENKMKAPGFLVSVDFPPHTDGVSTISKELSLRISEAGQDMIVLGPKDKGDRALDRHYLYRAYRVRGYEWGYLRILPMIPVFPWIVLRHKIRKIFAMNIAYGGLLSWAASFFLPVEYLLFAYGYEFQKMKGNSLTRRIYQSVYRRSKHIVACSENVRQRLIDFGGAAPEKISVRYPGVDQERYRPLPLSPDFMGKKGWVGKRILLTVGRLVERKGHDFVIEAISKLKEKIPDLLYVIVGIGPHDSHLRQLVQQLGVQSHVQFLGKVPPEDLPLIYNACEIFVMPSREINQGGHVEGFGIVYLEANACGKPVIGGRSGGVTEAINDGVSGLLIDPENADELIEKIEHLLTRPEEMCRLGEQGLSRVREKFHWDSYVRDCYRFLNDEELCP